MSDHLDHQHNYESDLVQQYKEQLKDCQVELSEKSEQLESFVLEKRDAIAEKGKDIDCLVEKIARIKQEHANEIKELEKTWKAIVQQRIDNLQTKHEEELNELTKEWHNERKVTRQILKSRTCILVLQSLMFHLILFLSTWYISLCLSAQIHCSNSYTLHAHIIDIYFRVFTFFDLRVHVTIIIFSLTREPKQLPR